AAFGPFGELLVVVGTDGTVAQYDVAGAHSLTKMLGLGSVLSASVGFGPKGEVLAVVTPDNLLTQYDAAGAHFLLGNVLSASVGFLPALAGASGSCHSQGCSGCGATPGGRQGGCSRCRGAGPVPRSGRRSARPNSARPPPPGRSRR